MVSQPIARRQLLVIALAASGALTVWPGSATAVTLDEAWQLFAQAQAGQDAAAEKAAQAFNALLQAQPGHPVLMAYAGAATAMRARSTWLPWKKLAWAEEGLALQDKALALLNPTHDAPMLRATSGTLETKYIAASTFLGVPSFMNRGARGEKLLAEVLGSPLFESSPLTFRGSVWVRAARHARGAERIDEARRLYERVVNEGAPQAEAAREALKELAS